MKIFYNPNAKKKVTNLRINSDLPKKEQEIKNWEIQNKTSVNSYNQRVMQNGTFSDTIRSF